MKKYALWISACAVLVTAGIVLAALCMGCDAAGGGGEDYLESIKGAWSSGIKTNVTMGGPARDTALLTILRNPSFESYFIVDNDGMMVVAGGNKGTIVTVDEEYLTVNLQQEFDNDTGTWKPASGYSVAKYSVEGDTFIMIPDINEDSIYDGTTLFDDDATIDMDYDFRIITTREPEGVTVTGTITFESGSYFGPSGKTLGIGMDESDIFTADYSTFYTVNNGDTFKDYSIPNVGPGIYYIGASIDLGTPGNYVEWEDWLGSYGDVNFETDPPNAPVFSDNPYDFDFTLQAPSD
jgi:hypothetical protein